MKHRILTLAFAIAVAVSSAFAASDFVNLTPQPKSITEGEGSLTLPTEFVIASTNLTDDMQTEITKFIADFGKATGISITTGSEGLFNVTLNSEIAEEGYNLTITTDGVSIEASTAAGLYYAFQTIKKISPANVAVGVYVANTYTLPVVTIADEPRYVWRGMEIDCARHFFSIDELKKMLDIMAVYKMNRLHWHITDDQGWRLEMPKYPKLTSEATVPVNNYMCDFETRTSYMLNAPYGPYYYTVEEMKDLVAYAKERHIEICPEIDMPGHMSAAIAAYPEFSTTPESDHPVRYWPGVSTDILDISNPAVVQFLKDIMDQLIEIFPYEYIHIGGDECPTTAWAASESCQQFKEDYGLTSDRAIQNWLTKELSDYVKPQGRRLICWNEIITADGADKQMAKEADILVYAWLNPGATNNPSKQAAELGLRSVWCSTNHYYLDYPQWSGSDEPLSMGFTITLQTVYNTTPDYDEAKKELYYGVNCNLWTEYISDPSHLEYNALPRMIAVAETGWTPQAKKDFSDFKKRFNADTKMLDYGNYTYGRHYVESTSEDVVLPEEGKYYRLITQASADANRKDRCIELVHDNCSLISDNSATAGLLWTNTQAAEGDDCYNWQYWTFEADPDGSGMYAMVNRAAGSGSVNPAMSGSSVNATWSYDYTTKHYEFVLGEQFGTTTNGYTYTIRSNQDSDGWLNCGQAAQNLRVNNWNNPADGNGGIWAFVLEGAEATTSTPTHPAFTPLQVGKTYVFANAANNNRYIQAVEGASYLSLTDADNYAWTNRAWVVLSSEYNETDNTAVITLSNAMIDGHYVGTTGDAVTTNSAATSYGSGAFNGDFGSPITIANDEANAAQITMYRTDSETEEYVLVINDLQLFPIAANNSYMPNAVSSRATLAASQNGTWVVEQVDIMAFGITSTDGEINTFKTGLSSDKWTSPYPNYEVKQAENGAITLERVSNVATYVCRDADGTIWETVTETVPVGTEYTPTAPEFSYMTFDHFDEATDSWTFNPVYTTDAHKGVKRNNATELISGETYFIEDTHTERHAFRYASGAKVYGSVSAVYDEAKYIWQIEEVDGGLAVMNTDKGRYIQAVTSSATTTVGKKAYAFEFTYNTAGDYWTVKNSGNDLVWDGYPDLSMTGWSAPGHPYRFYSTAEADPLFEITIEERDQDGELLASKTVSVSPGDSYIFAAASRPGKELVSVTGNEGLDNVTSNKLITVVYTIDKNSITEVAADNATVKGIYDLQGRKLSKPGHAGVYIIDGVKTIVR